MQKENKIKRRGVVLLSGGVDSTTTLAIAARKGFAVYALSFRYGQRNTHELKAASALAKSYSAEKHLIIDINLSEIGGSALTTHTPVPKGGLKKSHSEIPITYVPARNTIFLSFALAWAEVLNVMDIFIGVNALDYSGYPDCRPEYIEAFEKMANLATRSGVEGEKFTIQTPLMNLTKSQIIQKGIELGVDYSMTSSCYDPDSNGISCGQCESCLIRKKGFKDAGLKDPIMYKE